MVFIPWIIGLVLLAIDRGIKRPAGARSPYKAAAASLFLPGLGQLYNGQPRRALLLWTGGVALVLVAKIAGLLLSFWGMTFVVVAGLALSVGALVDALRTARLLREYKAQSFNRWYVYVGAIAVVAMASIPVERALAIDAFRVPTESMSPSLLFGDYFIARLETPDSYEDKRGDVLVFRYPGDNRTLYIKRVVAFPGEDVEIRGGLLLVNGQTIAAPWARTMEASTLDTVRDFGPFTVPDQTLFMLGDDLSASADSRAWGPLPRENIVGVAEFIYWSWDPSEREPRFSRIGRSVEGGH